MKIFGSVIGVLLALSVVFMLMGVSLGAKTSIYWDESGVYSEGGNETKQSNISVPELAPFVDIDINMVSCNIQFFASNCYGFDLSSNNSDFTWSLQNGKLSITEKTRSRWLSLDLRLMKNVFGDPDSANLCVYLPTNALLQNVYIKSISGYVTVSDLTCAFVDINTVSARTRVENVVANKMLFDGVSGGLTVKNCQFDSTRINIVSGDTFISDHKGSLSLSSISGRIEAAGELIGSSEFNTVSGNVRLLIIGTSGDYSKQFNLIGGSLQINGKSYNRQYSDNTGAPYSLKVTSTSGKVEVVFLQVLG